MRWPLAIIVTFTIQLNAEAPESAEFSPHSPQQNWGRSRDAFVHPPAQSEARVKAFIRDLLREDRPEVSSTPQTSVEGID